jgi:Flp pilus assembly protein TadG
MTRKPTPATLSRHRPADGSSAEAGSAALELAIATPAVLLVLLLIVASGRMSTAHSQVQEAARDAARAGSLQRTLPAAVAAAQAATDLAFAGQQVHCTSRDTTTTGSFETPGVGGSVHVTVRCEVPLSDLSVLPLPGSRTVTAESTEVLDIYRGGP